jgi:hypothetical protein
MRRLFGCKAKIATGGNRKLHNESLYNVCASQYIIKTIKSNRRVKEGIGARAHTHTKEMKIVYTILVRKIYDETVLGRYRSRYKSCINLNI